MTEQWLEDVYRDYHSWKGWNSRTADADARRSAKDLRAAEVDAPASLLEIGYGDGAFLLKAAQLGYTCSGIEIDDRRVDYLQEKGIDARAGSIRQFQKTDFDVIVAFDVFEHVDVQDLLDMLRLAHAHLAKNGRLVARFPNMASPFGLINQYGDITHKTPLSAQSLIQLAHVAGFKPVKAMNASVSLESGSLLRTIFKPASVIARGVVELILSFAIYGRLTPLGANIVVVLRKDS